MGYPAQDGPVPAFLHIETADKQPFCKLRAHVGVYWEAAGTVSNVSIISFRLFKNLFKL